MHQVAARVRRIKEILERRIAPKNVAFYCAPGAAMTELQFVNAVLAEADCDRLLDVNNIDVDSVNHGYEARAFLHGLLA